MISELGPHHVLGSQLNVGGIVHRDISGLSRDEEYCLRVTLATATYRTMSDSYCFGIFFAVYSILVIAVQSNSFL